MKNLKLTVLSLVALVCGRPPGLCTANTQAEDIAAMQARLDAQEAELARLRAAQIVPVAPPPEVSGTTALLLKGAGVAAENVNWRIRAGLSPTQAVEVAAREKAEAEEAAKTKSKK